MAGGGLRTEGVEPSKGEEFLIEGSAAGLRCAPFLVSQALYISCIAIQQAKGAQGNGAQGKCAVACFKVAEGVLILCLDRTPIYATEGGFRSYLI